MGLPSQHRLKKRLDFDTVHQQGIRRSSRYFLVKIFILTPNTTSHSPPSKLGICISRKVSKKAVVRNAIKRHLRVAFRQLLPWFQCSCHIVVIVKPEVKECKYEHFLRELEKLLIQAKVIHGY